MPIDLERGQDGEGELGYDMVGYGGVMQGGMVISGCTCITLEYREI